VIDSIRQPGGQCSELYPDKPIYDIPAIPVCSGAELTERLLQQIEPFDCGMHLGEEVQSVERRDDGSFLVETGSGKKFEARAVVIAGGVGSFQPRPLRLPNADQFTGHSLHYRVRNPGQFAGRKLAVVGGGDSALDWALELVGDAEHLTLVHRRDEYRAAPDTVRKMRELVESGQMDVLEHSKVTAIDGEGHRITAVTVQPKEGEASVIPIDHVLVFFGLAPKLGPIAEWGLDINRKTVNVDTEKFETSTPGIYAVGDINYYPGKKKLILCGFHEAALAAFAIKQRIEPDRKVHVQYTTTSPIMHERLGIQDDAD
jgi:thioredoxin reductase (NADPH)